MTSEKSIAYRCEICLKEEATIFDGLHEYCRNCAKVIVKKKKILTNKFSKFTYIQTLEEFTKQKKAYFLSERNLAEVMNTPKYFKSMTNNIKLCNEILQFLKEL